MKKLLSFMFISCLHLLAILVIIFVFKDLAVWYFENPQMGDSALYSSAKPLWGVDFYYTVNLVKQLSENFSLPPGGWLYSWFSGWPLFFKYPVLHYYLILPLLNFFFLLDAVKIWMLICTVLFVVGSYFSFYALSRNLLVSLALSLGGLFSVGFWGGLMWGGSLPSYATQAFLPWCVYFIIKYLQSDNIRNLLVAGLLIGLSIWGHPQVVIAYILPYVSIIILTTFSAIKLLTRIKNLLFLFLVSLIISFPIVSSSFGGIFKSLIVTNSIEVATSTVSHDSQVEKDINAFHKSQPQRIYTDLSKSLFLMLPVSAFMFVVGLVLSRNLRPVLKTLPYILLAVWGIIYVVMFSYGISIYHGGWYRLFWAPVFWLGLLSASMWGVFEDGLRKVLKKYFVIISICSGIIVSGIVFTTLISEEPNFQEKLISRSNPSSAYPDILNTYTTRSEFAKLKEKLVPKWMNPNSTDYRFYTADQTINLWWNSLFKMPLARGYFDPPLEKTRGYTFWLDAALSYDQESGKDQLASSFNYPEEIAFNNTLFLIDWYAVKYLEAGHGGPSVLTLLPEKIKTEEFIENREVLDFNTERYFKGAETLNYYELKSDFVGPILAGTNAKSLGIFASDEGYETIIRGFADANIGSKSLIPIKLGRNIDSIGLNVLQTFDALILYDYKYKNQGSAFSKLYKYLNNGGKLFIDTGVEGPESENESLPEIFPQDKTIRKPIADTWNLEVKQDEITSGINFFEFSPPVFDKFQWKFSYPPDEEYLREGSQVLLKNHNHSVLTRMNVGNGEIIWSGINLPYHVSRNHNSEEVKLYKRVIESLVTLDDVQTPPYTVNFVNSNKRIISTSNATGIIFKEQYYTGWNATYKSGNMSKPVKIWPAGPAYPGFMYVRLPNAQGESATVTFNFKGSLNSWLIFGFVSLTLLFILELTLLRGVILGRLTKFIWNKSSHKLGSWWGREDD